MLNRLRILAEGSLHATRGETLCSIGQCRMDRVLSGMCACALEVGMFSMPSPIIHALLSRRKEIQEEEITDWEEENRVEVGRGRRSGGDGAM